jgi:uncharacterized membrane-anchored protein YitT (DUF2179 family)
MKISLISLFLILLITSACNRTQKESTAEKTINTEKKVIEKPAEKFAKKVEVENFNSFYKHFHNDSLFQISRIKFPLKKEDNFQIEKENWLMHRSTINSIDTSMFKAKVTKANNYYKEVIYIEGGGFYLEREFKQIKGKWYLTSFVDENY